MHRPQVAFGSEHMHPNIARAFDVYADNDKRLLVIVVSNQPHTFCCQRAADDHES